MDDDSGGGLAERLRLLYRRAVYAELAANEGRLHTENGLDFSVAGLADQLSPASLAPLLQQAVLLAGSCDGHGADIDGELLLDDALAKIQALSAGGSSAPPAAEAEAAAPWIDALTSLATEECTQKIRSISSYYEELLSPPPAHSVSHPHPHPHPQPQAQAQAKENRPGGVNLNRSVVPAPAPTATVPPTAPATSTASAAPRTEFVTAGQMVGRAAPPPKTDRALAPSGVSRKPPGLSKRARCEGAKAGGAAQFEGDPKEQDGEEWGGDERLRGIDPKLLETIQQEIIHRVDTVTWEHIAGLEHAKNTIKEIVIWPMLRPDIFTGLRGPPKGLLLFGPPGTGKTMIGKCIASQAKATFFSISASSLTSKWVGEGEKLVRALFACARALQPSVVFIDEIDSLLTQRTDGEFEASRRIKTEFLVQFDGAATSSTDRILIIGATNRPQELDEAARRRLVKRLYIPLPDVAARSTIIRTLLHTQNHSLAEDHITEISVRTDGYSGADMDNLCREAALGPIRNIENILEISPDQVRPIIIDDFHNAMSQVRASVSQADLHLYLDWNDKFGSLAAK